MWTTGNTFEEAPVGNHVARLIEIVDIGTQTGEYEGKETKRRQNIFTWELVDEFREDGKPFTISKFYTASIGDTSNLYKDLTSWLGKPPVAITDKKGKIVGLDPDPKSLIGKGCNVVIIENKKGKHVVSMVAGLGKNDKVEGESHYPTVFFSLDSFDEAVYDNLSDWRQQTIAKSPEYAKIVGGDVSDGPEQNEEDIPF